MQLLANDDGGHIDAARGEERPREQSISAVVSRTCEQCDAQIVGIRVEVWQEFEHGVCRGSCGHLHERRAFFEQWPFHGAHRVDVVCG